MANVNDLSFVNSRQDIDNLFMQTNFFTLISTAEGATLSQPNLQRLQMKMRYNQYIWKLFNHKKSSLNLFDIEAYARSYADLGEISQGDIAPVTQLTSWQEEIF